MRYLVHEHTGQTGFTVEELGGNLIESGVLSGISEKNVKKAINTTLNSLTGLTGLKSLGLIQKAAGRTNWYGIHPRCPELLIAAYIIYVNWPSHTAKIAISEILSGRNSLGKLFFLTRFQVMSILRELEERGMVKIETAASLDQIGRDSRITPTDILEMIVVEA
jgi:hypothetical protein